VNARVGNQWRQSGVDAGVAIDELIRADNATLAGVNRRGSVFGLHMCRGNNRSNYFAEGSYERVAEKAFSSLNYDRFLLEYDSDRAGGFEPLRFVPAGMTVVLGLISTKTSQLESQENLLRRIDEASHCVPLENLALSPQCGFASVLQGNVIECDDQRRKLELLVDTAHKCGATPESWRTQATHRDPRRKCPPISTVAQLARSARVARSLLLPTRFCRRRAQHRENLGPRILREHHLELARAIRLPYLDCTGQDV
jgi:hypothetical protein